jgi:ankyrin repeat protein
MEAASERHIAVLKCLLNSGASINAQTEETHETATTLSSCGGFLEVVDTLVENGADIEAGALTPLTEAAQEGHFSIVKYVIYDPNPFRTILWVVVGGE